MKPRCSFFFTVVIRIIAPLFVYRINNPFSDSDKNSLLDENKLTRQALRVKGKISSSRHL